MPAGVMMVYQPDGSLLGLQTDILQNSPFNNFFIPGILLASLFGGGCLIAILLVVIQSQFALRYIVFIGIVLMIWMIVQMMLVPYYNWIQGLYFVIGILLTLLSYHLMGKAAF